MEELEILVADTGVLIDELIGLMPEEPTTELEAKAGELAAKATQLLAQLSAVEADDGGEEIADEEYAEEVAE